MDAGVTGILLAHPLAYSSGELKKTRLMSGPDRAQGLFLADLKAVIGLYNQRQRVSFFLIFG